MSNISITNSSQCPLLSLDFQPQPVASLPKIVAPTWIALCVVHSLTAPVIFCINLLIIWSICEDVRLRSTCYNILIVILAFTDILVACVVQPIFLSLLICLLLDCPVSCQIGATYIVASLVCCGWSLATLTVIALERYLAIEHPLTYNSTVTMPRIFLATAVSWAIACVFLLVGRFQANASFKVRQIPVALFVSVCCLIIVLCVAKIFHTTRRHRSAIAVQEAVVSQAEETERTKTRLKEFKRYFTFGIILSAAVLLYLPSLLAKIVGVSLGKHSTPDFKYISQFIWGSCIYLQSLANPLIVSLRLSYVRKGVFQKLIRQPR